MALVRKTDLRDQLSAFEKKDLKAKIDAYESELKAKADKKFDSSKNWSIMIDDKHNEIRNNVMRKFKFK